MTEAVVSPRTCKLSAVGDSDGFTVLAGPVDRTIDPHDATIFGVPLSGADAGGAPSPPVQTNTKTGRFDQSLLDSETERVIATIEDGTVTVTRMSVPDTGRPYLLIALNYVLTSHGIRTGRGWPTDEPLGIPHGIYFQNRHGGVMYSHFFAPNDLYISCDTDRERRYYPAFEYNHVTWFDDWKKFEYSTNGYYYDC